MLDCPRNKPFTVENNTNRAAISMTAPNKVIETAPAIRVLPKR
jgi:hypothetical protein